MRCSSLHLLHCFTLRLRRSGPRCPLVRLRGGSAPSATADGAPPIVVPPIATEPKPIPGESMMPAESRGIVGGGRIGANGHGPWMRGIGSATRGGGIGSAARGGGIGSAARGGGIGSAARGGGGGGGVCRGVGVCRGSPWLRCIGRSITCLLRPKQRPVCCNCRRRALCTSGGLALSLVGGFLGRRQPIATHRVRATPSRRSAPREGRVARRAESVVRRTARHAKSVARRAESAARRAESAARRAKSAARRAESAVRRTEGWLLDQAASFTSFKKHLSRCTQPESRRTHRPITRPTDSLGGRKPLKTGAGRCAHRDSGCAHRERCFLVEEKRFA